jgi:hypothetical protein
MNNKQFDQLPPELQLAFTLGMASKIFGRQLVQQIYQNMKPLFADMFGHGHAIKRAVGDADDPKDNYWGGVWQIYDTGLPQEPEREEPQEANA